MPRFSIVVTTTDRQPLLAPAIRSVLAMNFADYELVISDNFSQPSTAPIVSEFTDPRIRFFRTDRRLPLADHWDFVWQQVRGDFVIFLGDDNALHPDILTLADRELARHDLQLMGWRVCTYFHPDWDIVYPGLPRRGNLLTFDPGTTGRLYRCDPAAILRSYCAELRTPECFPGMINCLFSRECGETIRQQTGRVFWPLAPDVAVGYFLLGLVRPQAFGFLDGYGAVGGRSRDSNVATFLSRGKNSRRAYDLFSEHATDYFPHHPVKFRSMANIMAAIISLAAALMPDRFGAYQYSSETLALETLDDMYTRHITPWVDDPRFLEQVEGFFLSLPAEQRAQIFAYRDQCIARRDETERALEALSAAPARERRSFWTDPPHYNLDAAGFWAHDIAETARALPEILQMFDRDSERFVVRGRAAGHVAEELPVARSWHEEGTRPTERSVR